MQRVPSVLANLSTKTTEDTPTLRPAFDATNTLSLPEWSQAAFSPTALQSSPVATFSPVAYQAGYAYPLLVWLHGEACHERSLHNVMQHVSLRNYVGVAPRGVMEAEDGYNWADDSQSVDQATDSIFEAIDHARERFHVHDRRIFLVGVGTGGTTALRIALQHPAYFAGAATLGGPAPQGNQPLSCIKKLRELPLLLSASRESATYPEHLVCRDLALLHSAGCHVAVRQYPADDALTTSMLADLNRWAMEIVCG